MELSIIIPTKDRKQIFAATLSAAIEATHHLEAEIIVVNDSKTDSPKIAKAANVFLWDNPKSGVAAARNFGFRHSRGDLILFLDDDIIITRESINHVLRLHSAYSNACFNLNWEYCPDMLNEISLLPFTRFLKAFQMISFKGWYNDPSWKDNQLFISKSVASFHLSISRKNFEKTGGYNEEFPFAGFEDYDFPIRLRTAGIENYIDSRIAVWHNESDRLELSNWLMHQQKRASTRRKAVSLGYGELVLEYGPWKKMLLSAISKNECLFKSFLKLLPNSNVTDPLHFKLISALQASRIYKGYMLK